jgi:glucokinase
VEAAQIYVRILGAELGNLALIHLPFGGLFLIGGVARAFQPYLGRFGFEAAFKDKGRFSDFMENFRVQVIEDDYAALTGCARTSAQHSLRQPGARGKKGAFAPFFHFSAQQPRRVWSAP